MWVVGAPSPAGSRPGKMGASPGETREGLSLYRALLLPLVALTWGSPMRRLARLGEQLLTEVKALRKIRLREAKASR